VDSHVHPELLRGTGISVIRTIQQELRDASSRFEQAGIDTARLDAEVLLRHVLDIDRTQLFLRSPEPMPEAAAGTYATLVDRRLAGEPVAYLTGIREFMALPFRVAPGVLIPRPDTEPLVEWALDWLRARPDSRVADIGTGSGAIAIAIAAHAPESFSGHVIAIDTSPDALAIANDNADSTLSSRRRALLEFRQGSLTTPLHEPVDLLLANLPYLTPEQIAENPDLDAEPRLALEGGPDGLVLVREVIADLPRVLAPGGAAGFEIDPSQADTVETLLRDAFPDGITAVVLDLARLSRHVVLNRRISVDNACGTW
jgi:release factor glutamine methyltransferase